LLKFFSSLIILFNTMGNQFVALDIQCDSSQPRWLSHSQYWRTGSSLSHRWKCWIRDLLIAIGFCVVQQPAS
jgi:hypothetical protein